MSDFITDKGSAAFGTRLRRLSERLDRDVRELYREHGIEFEPSWYPVVASLGEIGPTSVGDLASHMRISHAAVSQIRGKLLKASLVSVREDAADHRRQVLRLTRKGQALVGRLRPLWEAIAHVTEQLNRLHAPHLLRELTALETALDEQSLIDRVSDKMGRRAKIKTDLKGKSNVVR